MILPPFEQCSDAIIDANWKFGMLIAWAIVIMYRAKVKAN